MSKKKSCAERNRHKEKFLDILAETQPQAAKKHLLS